MNTALGQPTGGPKLLHLGSVNYTDPPQVLDEGFVRPLVDVDTAAIPMVEDYVTLAFGPSLLARCSGA